MEIKYTSHTQRGQIYIPQINRLLLIGVLLLCILFGNSGALASAYGIAVIGTMLVSSLLSFVVVYKVWKKSLLFSLAIVAPFLIIELVFFASNMMKVLDGGYVPLGFATAIVIMMAVWVKGTAYLFGKSREQAVPMSELLEQLDRHPPNSAEGTAIFLTSDPSTVPDAMIQNLNHNKVLHEKNIILTIITAQSPVVQESRRMVIEHLSSNMTRVVLHFGYIETPDVPGALLKSRLFGLDIDVENATFFLGRRKIVSDPRTGLPGWQDNIYIAMSHSAATVTDFYLIPPHQVVEMGRQVIV
jgi:KUP system potassium uptake protein